MRGEVLDRGVRLPESRTENAGEVCEHHESGFGVAAHVRSQLFGREAGEFDHALAGRLRAPGLIVYQADFAKNASRADLGKLVSRLGAYDDGAVENYKEVRIAF